MNETTNGNGRTLDADAIIIGGGPAGSALAAMLAQDGHRALVLEKDIHPRDHVGESLTPSTNLVFDKIGFMDKMDDAGFIRKPGTGWNAPRSPLWKFIEIWLFEFPLPGTPRPYTFNVERDVLDTMLIRHAHEAEQVIERAEEDLDWPDDPIDTLGGILAHL